jgi:DNA-directed RNA polymerase subunit H (RpoH/RPB5)
MPLLPHWEVAMDNCAAYRCEMATASPHDLCPKHFNMLPTEMQDRILREYAVAQENSTPYLIARMKAIRYLNERLQKVME